GGHGELEAGILQDLPALLHVGPLQADDDGYLHLDLFYCLHHPVGQDVATQDAAEDIDEHPLDAGVPQDDAEAVADHLGGGAAAHVQEVSGFGAGGLDQVHGGHGQASAIHHGADIAAEADVVELVLAG